MKDLRATYDALVDLQKILCPVVANYPGDYRSVQALAATYTLQDYLAPAVAEIERSELVPGNGGQDCPYNGHHPDKECRCDECDFLGDCFLEYLPET